jgi:hypothetical protein
VKTGIRVIQERNLQLSNYTEELTRTFLDMGHTIRVDRCKAKREEEGVPVSMVPEEKVFSDHKGTTGIMAHYQENEDELTQKEKEETLTPDEQALLKMVHYISNFDQKKWPILSYEYWLDYRYKLVKDKRLQIILHGTSEAAEDELDRANRYQIARAEGDKVEENLGILHTSTVPEFTRASFYAFTTPLFRLFDLLDLKENFLTDSVKIKMAAPDVEEALRECRVLLGPSGWNGIDLHENPTYAQLLRFLSDMMHALVDGTLTVKNVKRCTTEKKVETTDKRTKSGKTTRKKQVKVMEYELQFNPPEKPNSDPFTALDRVGHLVKLDL